MTQPTEAGIEPRVTRYRDDRGCNAELRLLPNGRLVKLRVRKPRKRGKR